MKKTALALLALAVVPVSAAVVPVPAATAVDSLPYPQTPPFPRTPPLNPFHPKKPGDPIHNLPGFSVTRNYYYEKDNIVSYETGGIIPAPYYIDPFTHEHKQADDGTEFGTFSQLPEGIEVRKDGSVTVASHVPTGSYDVHVFYIRPDNTKGSTEVKFEVKKAPQLSVSQYNVVYRPVDYPNPAKLLVLGPNDASLGNFLVKSVTVADSPALPAGYSARVGQGWEIILTAPASRVAATISVPLLVTFKDSAKKPVTAQARFKVPAAGSDPSSDPTVTLTPAPTPAPAAPSSSKDQDKANEGLWGLVAIPVLLALFSLVLPHIAGFLHIKL